MTRINLIPPADLCNQHLVAEYRELPRIFALARVGANVPDKYCLGKGHVTFFYNKLAWLYKRQCALVQEMRERGITVNFDPEALREQWHLAKHKLWNDWEPETEEIALNLARIDKRRVGMGLFPTYECGAEHARGYLWHHLSQKYKEAV